MESLFLQLLNCLPAVTFLFLIVFIRLKGASPASCKHQLVIGVFFLALLLPIIYWFIPKWRILPRLDIETKTLFVEYYETVLLEKLTEITFFVWGVGFCVVLLRFIICNVVAKLAIAKSHIVDDYLFLLSLSKIKEKLGVLNPVEIRVSHKVKMPMVWGANKPILILPIESYSWCYKDLEIVITHELAHVKRHDFYSNIIRELAYSVYWFHPLAIYLIRQQVLLREIACDDHVVLSGFNSENYAKLLLKITTGVSIYKNQNSELSSGLGGGKALKRRLVSLLDGNKKREILSKRKAFKELTLVALVGVFLASLGMKVIAEYHSDLNLAKGPHSSNNAHLEFSVWDDIVEPWIKIRISHEKELVSESTEIRRLPPKKTEPLIVPSFKMMNAERSIINQSKTTSLLLKPKKESSKKNSLEEVSLKEFGHSLNNIIRLPSRLSDMRRVSIPSPLLNSEKEWLVRDDIRVGVGFPDLSHLLEDMTEIFLNLDLNNFFEEGDHFVYDMVEVNEFRVVENTNISHDLLNVRLVDILLDIEEIYNNRMEIEELGSVSVMIAPSVNSVSRVVNERTYVGVEFLCSKQVKPDQLILQMSQDMHVWKNLEKESITCFRASDSFYLDRVKLYWNKAITGSPCFLRLKMVKPR